jgi:hypothetical protein
MIYQNELIKALCFDTIGFAFKGLDDGYGYIYEKEINDCIVRIMVKFEQGKYYTSGVVLLFKQIEEIISELCKKHNLEYNNYCTLGFYNLTDKNESIFSLNKKALETEYRQDTVGEIGRLIFEYVTNLYQSLWEKYSSLQVVNDEIIDKVDQLKLSGYIPFMMDLKKMIIMKNCNNVRYNEYIKWLDSTWEEDAKTIDITKDSYYLAYCELKEILM